VLAVARDGSCVGSGAASGGTVDGGGGGRGTVQVTSRHATRSLSGLGSYPARPLSLPHGATRWWWVATRARTTPSRLGSPSPRTCGSTPAASLAATCCFASTQARRSPRRSSGRSV
jgi:hypothetical protein